MKVSGEEGEDGIQGTGVGVLEYDKGCLILRGWEKGGISKKEPTFVIRSAFKLVGLHVSLRQP